MSIKILELNNLSEILYVDIPLSVKLSALQTVMPGEKFEFMKLLVIIEIIEMLKLELAHNGLSWTNENENLYNVLVALDTSYISKENYEEKEKIAKMALEVLNRGPATSSPGGPKLTDKISLIALQGIISNIKTSTVFDNALPSSAFIPICDTLKKEYNLPIEDIFANCFGMANSTDTSLGDLSSTLFRDALHGKQSEDVKGSDLLH